MFKVKTSNKMKSTVVKPSDQGPSFMIQHKSTDKKVTRSSLEKTKPKEKKPNVSQFFK